MWIKLVGVILVWFGCIGIGNELVDKMRKRRMTLEDLRKKVLLLRGEIGYANATLPEAIDRIVSRTGETAGLFVSLEEKMCQEDGVAFAEKWRGAVTGMDASCGLTEADKKELVRLGECLGGQEKETQLRQLDWYLGQSEELLSEIRKGEKEKVRLYRMLSVLGGAFLCIMMI